jgi:hypothetical protein
MFFVALGKDRMTMNSLNKVQLEILKLFQVINTEKELQELKQLLIQYLSRKLVEEADKAFDEKAYTQEDLYEWKNEHFRIEKIA